MTWEKLSFYVVDPRYIWARARVKKLFTGRSVLKEKNIVPGGTYSRGRCKFNSTDQPKREVQRPQLREGGSVPEHGPEEVVAEAGRVGLRDALGFLALEVPGDNNISSHVSREEVYVHLSLSFHHGRRAPLHHPAAGPVVALHVRLHRLHPRVDDVGGTEWAGQLAQAAH